MGEVLETVVAENRQLRKEMKTLRERVAAVEASRWWRLHPRFALQRLRGSDATTETQEEPDQASRVARLARQWRLKAVHDRRNAGCMADEIVIRDGLELKIHPESRHAIEHFCFRAPEMVDELDVFIANTSDRRRLLDAGAYHGVFSLVFTANDPTKEALAVDPSLIAFPKLLYTINKNGAKNVRAVESALSNEDGVLEMHYVWETVIAGQDDNGQPLLRIESRAGDSLCEEYSFAPDTIKIDVEGHEANVVEGLQKTIAHNRPLIFLEVHPAMIAANPDNGTAADLVRLLRELRYSKAELGGSIVLVDALAGLTQIERCLLRPD